MRLAAAPEFIGSFVVAAARAMVRGDQSWCARVTGLACAVVVVAIGGAFDAHRASPTGALLPQFFFVAVLVVAVASIVTTGWLNVALRRAA